jgi:hypothetical protein
MNGDKRKELTKKLDAFIEENFEPLPPSFKAMPGKEDDEKKSEEERERKKLEAFIRENLGRQGPQEKHFANILEDMRKELGLTPPGIYKPALITRFHYSKIIGPERSRPERDTVLVLAFALIRADTRKNNPPIYVPEERMKILLFSGGGTEFLLRKSSVFDVVILFCICEKVFDISDVNFYLGLKELPLIPKTRRKNAANRKPE